MKKLFLFTLVSAIFPVMAEVKLPDIFSDGAVLQKSASTAVFGIASPGEKVTVSYQNRSSSCVTDFNGRWLVRLDLSDCGNQAAELVVKGKNTVISKDVITGDVWLCAGQSNMRFTVQRVLNAEKEMASSKNDSIRNFIVKNPIPFADGEGGKRSALFAVGTWQKAAPETVGSFSAVGYFFARMINAGTGNAVGLVDPSIGASSIESHLSRETLFHRLSKAVADEASERIAAYKNYDAVCAEYAAKLQKWECDCNVNDRFSAKSVPQNAKWRKVGKLASSYPGNGVIWFRKKGVIKKSDIVNKFVRIKLGYPRTPAIFYIDGMEVGRFTSSDAAAQIEFKFSVPENIAFAGEHEFALRFHVSSDRCAVFTAFTLGKSCMSIKDWEMFREVEFPRLTAIQRKAKPLKISPKPHPQTLPGRIFDRKLHPIFPFTLKGVLWYQGENNTDKTAPLYAEMLTAFIGELRENFCAPELPFYAVQLTGFKKKSSDAGDSGTWPTVRAGQTQAVNSVKNAYEVVILDLGEAEDIHPIAKQEVGIRLAHAALANTYGRKNVRWQSPYAEKATLSGSSVIVKFSATCGKLEAADLPPFYWLKRSAGRKAPLVRNVPDSRLEGFALRDHNGKWHWANAVISGNTVTVNSPAVTSPTAVRYAWQDNPTCNLTNTDKLPAHPFYFEL